jgi:hypothetical protein
VYDTFSAPPGAVLEKARLFAGEGPASDEIVSNTQEMDIVKWLLHNPIPRELLLEELGLPIGTYAQAGIIEPLLERNRTAPPGDLDLLLVPDVANAISVQVKRIPIIAESTEKDRTAGKGRLGNITRLVKQANGSRDIGFHLNYGMIVTEVYGVERSDYSFAFRGSSPGMFQRVYHMTWDQSIHDEVGVIFVEIVQPTRTCVDRAGVVAVCVDRRAKPLTQPASLTARVRQLKANMPSI